jgi:uncharacterized protein YggT (Ycf19 family)
MFSLTILDTLIDFIFGLTEALIGFRIVLKLLGANSNAPFVQWVNSLSQPFLNPFVNIFPPIALNETSTLDISAIFALVIYAALAKILIELVHIIDSGILRPKSKNKTTERDRIF